MGLAWQASIDAMAAALDGLIAKGYHLVTISQLIAMESPEVSPTPSPHLPAAFKASPKTRLWAIRSKLRITRRLATAHVK